MPKIKFKMLPPVSGEEETFVCKSCGDRMRMKEIDSHARDRHHGTSASVDTTT